MKAPTRELQRLPNWVAAAAPLVLLAALIAVFLVANPIPSLRDVPPVEEVAVERTVLNDHELVLELRNDGPDPVTVSQVLVNEAYWDHELSDRTLGRYDTATLTIPYPWDEGTPVEIALVTATGVTIEHEIEAAALTPEFGGRAIGIYALLGIYMGVVPVAIGLLWFPSLRRASPRWVQFVLAFTVGLLLFLLVDTVAEGLELAGETAAVLDGLGLFVIGAVAALAGLFLLEGTLQRRRAALGGSAAPVSTTPDAVSSTAAPSDPADSTATTPRSTATASAPATSGLTGLTLAYLISAGIGLHNLGEGLAVGTAIATGEASLATFLVLGFVLHNATEGLAIVSPLGSAARRPSLWHFAAFGAVAGGPTVLGTWAGGFAFEPAWATLAFGVAAGAIAQVVWTIARGMSNGRGLVTVPGAAGLVAGLVVMYATALLVSG